LATLCICKPNLVQLGYEVAETICLCISKVAAVRHLGFVIPGTTHDVLLNGQCLLCQWRNDRVRCDRDIAIL